MSSPTSKTPRDSAKRPADVVSSPGEDSVQVLHDERTDVRFSPAFHPSLQWATDQSNHRRANPPSSSSQSVLLTSQTLPTASNQIAVTHQPHQPASDRRALVSSSFLLSPSAPLTTQKNPPQSTRYVSFFWWTEEGGSSLFPPAGGVWLTRACRAVGWENVRRLLSSGNWLFSQTGETTGVERGVVSGGGGSRRAASSSLPRRRSPDDNRALLPGLAVTALRPLQRWPFAEPIGRLAPLSGPQRFPTGV